LLSPLSFTDTNLTAMSFRYECVSSCSPVTGNHEHTQEVASTLVVMFILRW